SYTKSQMVMVMACWIDSSFLELASICIYLTNVVLLVTLFCLFSGYM
ncbi:MAG: hypothetical protein ACI90V_011536, partial [Bacillariaceae sp.]